MVGWLHEVRVNRLEMNEKKDTLKRKREKMFFKVPKWEILRLKEAVSKK